MRRRRRPSGRAWTWTSVAGARADQAADAPDGLSAGRAAPLARRPRPSARAGVGADDRADLRHEQRRRARRSSRPRCGQALRRARGPGVLDRELVAAVARSARAGTRPCRSKARAGGADLLDRRDLLLEREDRLDLQRRCRAAPGPRRCARRGAGTPACRRRTRSSARRAPRAPRLRSLGDVAPRGGVRRPPPSARSPCRRPSRESKTTIRSRVHAALDELVARLLGRAHRARDPAGQVDRHDVAPAASSGS